MNETPYRVLRCLAQQIVEGANRSNDLRATLLPYSEDTRKGILSDTRVFRYLLGNLENREDAELLSIWQFNYKRSGILPWIPFHS